MKRMKKIFAMLLAFTMVLGMTVTVNAETSTVTTPSSSDKIEAKVTNVDIGATVTAYQIVEADYETSGNGFKGYVKAADSLDITTVTAPTVAEVLAIAQSDLSGLKSVVMTDEDEEGNKDGTYVAELEAGYWLVLISGGTEIYNPILLGVYYSVSGSDNTMVTDPEEGISADATWNLNSETGYAKSSPATIDKKILESDGNDNGNHVAIGDTVNFEISADIPAYSDAYETVVVKISDALSTGLTLKQDQDAVFTVTIDGETHTPAATDLTKIDSGFTLTIPSETALANAGKKVVVTYQATVNSSAGLNFNANTNTATLEYTHNPKDSTDTTTKEDKTYTYTFGIDADLDGTNSYTTQELFKVGVNADGTVGTVTKDGETITVTEPLAGATFKLTKVGTTKEYSATSDAQGMLTFTGLDVGEYTLVETAAPSGYSLNDTEHSVEITATLNDDGTLSTYSITIDDTNTSTYEETKIGDETTITKVVNPTAIANTKLINLPSTGGIGTTIFTVAGCGIMIAAAFFFFASRRKED